MSAARAVLDRLPRIRRLREELRGEALAAEMDARAAGVRVDRDPRSRAVYIGARELLELIDTEVLVVLMLTRDILERHTVSEADWSRLAQCAARIGAARDHAHGRGA